MRRLLYLILKASQGSRCIVPILRQKKGSKVRGQIEISTIAGDAQPHVLPPKYPVMPGRLGGCRGIHNSQEGSAAPWTTFQEERGLEKMWLTH